MLGSPSADHFPIITSFDLTVTGAVAEIRRNFKNVDWDNFRQIIARKLQDVPTQPHLNSPQPFDDHLNKIADAIEETITEVVPEYCESPMRKRWWKPELTTMRRNVLKLAARSKRA